MSNPATPRIAVTAGEPAGIGPDLIIALAGQSHTAELVVVADPDLLTQRAAQLGQPLTLRDYQKDCTPEPAKSGELVILPVHQAVQSTPGKLDKANSSYVLATLDRAADGCLRGEFAAMVTAPVQKNVVAEAGYAFSGHTEYLAERCGAEMPVMLLCADTLRVALVTTHLPLATVPEAITVERIRKVTKVLDRDLRDKFGLEYPHIAVLGLNPHAGETGQVGREELEVIAPTLEELRHLGLNLTGPLPADSAFVPTKLREFDAVLAMYHDQGLPVLKHAGFGNAVNVTLGLPIVRTSVDHGTALELAGSGHADPGSLLAALELATAIASRLAA